VLILGSGALKIGEAGEFDYSGSQAIKALKHEGISTVVINPNIATVQTSGQLADGVYFLPVNAYFVEQVLRKEQPDGILLGFGGQTALNCGLELARTGVLEASGVQVLGTPIRAIEETENRGLFARRIRETGVEVPRSAPAESVAEADQVARTIGYPVMLRIAYALGGLGSAICADEATLLQRAQQAFRYSPQILIEEALTGWKEVEYEVVRDRFDNCITVCNMENLDPLGIHTGESIVVAPSQTLSNAEYHRLRSLAIRVVRHLGIVGECNIQFALDSRSDAYRVIEVNARLSRSSALASKATGYPLAYVAAKLALGYSLVELPNSMTGVTQACFEPALDYVVVKMPRWDLKKFQHASKVIGSGMKSVGEVMAIGRTFEEALQKATRMLDIGAPGLAGSTKRFDDVDLEHMLMVPTPERIFVIAEAIKRGLSIERVHKLTHIDRWFLYKIRRIVQIGEQLSRTPDLLGKPELLKIAKQAGFSDEQIARLTGSSLQHVMEQRARYGIHPCVKQIDTLAAEYPARSNYLYLTYNGAEDDGRERRDNSVIVLGSGPYRIGSSVEFDWCCVSTVQALRRLHMTTIMINNNPETVSTDYNECDVLYFEELSLETVLEIYRKERPLGVIISMGGQTPNNLAMGLHRAGVRVLGTSPGSIDQAEDRHKFSKLLDRLGIRQPAWRELAGLDQALAFAKEVGYPVLVRPSYVLSGAAMGVASNDAELVKFIEQTTSVSREHPIVISKFVEEAKELEFDGVASNGRLLVWAISEHVENAGVHSGDATLVFPPQRTYLETMRRLKKVSAKIASALAITGPFNVQCIAKDNDIQIIECNLRASRSFPFVSKVSGVNFAELSTRVIMGNPVPIMNGALAELDYVGVKAPQFSFTRLEGVDPTVGVEMASTGEVACLGDDFEEAFLKAVLAVGFRVPVRCVLLSTGPLESKVSFLAHAKLLAEMGVSLYATEGTAAFLTEHGIPTRLIHWPLERGHPNAIELLESGVIDLVINLPKNYQQRELTNDYMIRRKAVDLAIPLITNMQLAQRFVDALSKKTLDDLQVKSWAEYASLVPANCCSSIDHQDH
jgi:carbamoyl-phosphate synthase large subunit